MAELKQPAHRREPKRDVPRGHHFWIPTSRLFVGDSVTVPPATAFRPSLSERPTKSGMYLCVRAGRSRRHGESDIYDSDENAPRCLLFDRVIRSVRIRWGGIRWTIRNPAGVRQSVGAFKGWPRRGCAFVALCVLTWAFGYEYSVLVLF